jgi:hypothetical protein
MDGTGEGIAVGEQIGGEPSGVGSNIGFSLLHSSGQHSGQLRPVGKGSASQSGLSINVSAQSGGRIESLLSKKQVSKGQSSMTLLHGVGTGLGAGVGISLGAEDGSGEGTGEGAPQESALKFKHSSGQQTGQSAGNGSLLQSSSLPISTQLLGLTFVSSLKHPSGHSLITSEHGVGAGVGSFDGLGVGAMLGLSEGSIVGTDITSSTIRLYQVSSSFIS